MRTGLFTKQKLQQEVETVYVQQWHPVDAPRRLAARNISVLLLHGAAFTSATWQKTQTMQTLSMAGYSVTAIDLPGYGRSNGQVSAALRKDFLAGLMAYLRLGPVVVVAPSMSGSFALPLLLDDAAGVSMRGFIGVAPVSVASHTAAEYFKTKLPILYIYGELDEKLGLSGAAVMRGVPNAEVKMVPKGSHPCYLDAPELFNTWLLEFLQKIESLKAK